MLARKKSTRVLAYQFKTGKDVDDLDNLREVFERAKFFELDPEEILESLREKRRCGDWLVLDVAAPFHHRVLPDEFFRRAYQPCSGSEFFFKTRSYELEVLIFKSLGEACVVEALVFVSLGLLGSLQDLSEKVKRVQERGYINYSEMSNPNYLYPGQVLLKGPNGIFYKLTRAAFDDLYEII